MRLRFVVGSALLACCLAPPLPAAPQDGDDLAAARAVFQRNLDAIARRDRAAYLACYLDSPRLARTGPEGFSLGFAELAKSAGEAWPDTFEANDLRLVPVKPGVVYGTYRYRVRYGAEEHAGLSERIFLKTDGGWKIAVTSAFDAPPGTPPPPRALIAATLVDGTGAPPVPDAVVLIRGGRIECAGPRSSCPVPEGVGVLDVRDYWITPGIVDAHVHFSQTGWADGRPDSIDVRDRHPYEKTVTDLEAHPERWFHSYLCSGVTAVFDVGGYPWTTALAKRVEGDAATPHVAAAGPLLSTRDHWLNLPAERQFIYLTDEESARAGVRYLASHGATAVKVWYIVTPERSVEASTPAILAAGDEARRAGLPLIVHATGLAEAKAALRAGARLLVHGVGDQPVDDEFIELARKNGTVYCPTLTVFRGYLRMFEAASGGTEPAIDDPNSCVDAETRAKLAETATLGGKEGIAAGVARLRVRVAAVEPVSAANLKRLHDAGIPIAMGTDAGNPLTLHGASVYAEMEAMQAAGLTPMQVLVASTRGGSLAMGRDKDLGTIEKGKAADLLVLAANPTSDIASLRKLRHVVRGGVVRSLDELKGAVAALPLGAGEPARHVKARRLESLLSQLAQFGRNPEGGVSRLGFSKEDQAAREWLIGKMEQAGLEVMVDLAANIHGRRAGSDPSLPAILFGSHIDSVPKGGNFDGDLGSLAALEVMQTLRDEKAVTRHPLEMVVWSNEEGVHYGKGLFGSRAATRGPDDGELEAKDEEGVSLADWLRRYGLDPVRIAEARLDPKRVAAYLELHIEQGGVLDRHKLQIGVVEGIVAIDRHHVTIDGFANHAGTTPMDERRDALVAAARLIQAVREEVMARPGRQVGNVGWVQVEPGAPNVVPGRVRLPIELRDLRREVMEDMIARVRVRAEAIARETGVTITIERYSTDEPAPTDLGLRDLIEKVAREAGLSTLRMPSGAGHDAQALGRIGIPIGMIFVPSQDGISHSPREHTNSEDCARGAEVLYGTLRELDTR